MPASATSTYKSNALLVGDADNKRKTGKQEGWISSNKRTIEDGKQGVRAGVGGGGGLLGGKRDLVRNEKEYGGRERGK